MTKRKLEITNLDYYQEYLNNCANYAQGELTNLLEFRIKLTILNQKLKDFLYAQIFDAAKSKELSTQIEHILTNPKESKYLYLDEKNNAHIKDILAVLGEEISEFNKNIKNFNNHNGNGIVFLELPTAKLFDEQPYTNPDIDSFVQDILGHNKAPQNSPLSDDTSDIMDS